jgi:hypothetical protein
MQPLFYKLAEFVLLTSKLQTSKTAEYNSTLVVAVMSEDGVSELIDFVQVICIIIHSHCYSVCNRIRIAEHGNIAHHAAFN